MNEKTKIVIDGKNWREWVLRDELIVTTREELIELATVIGPRAAAIAGIVSRLIGAAPADILRPDKSLLHSGAAAELYMAVRSLRTQVELENGRTLEVSSYSRPAPQRKDRDGKDDGDGKEYAAEADAFDSADQDDPSYAEAGTERYYDNAVSYLRSAVVGHIRKRLSEVAYCRGIDEAGREADLLKDQIDGVVGDLEREPKGL